MINVLTIEVKCSDCETVAEGSKEELEARGWTFNFYYSPNTEDGSCWCPNHKEVEHHE